MNFLYVLIALSLINWVESKCKSNDNFKYQLNYTSHVDGYHSVCSQFSKRTCCSPNNFDNLAKKIQKLIGFSPNLSHNCRRKLSNILCSTCDGDIGQSYIEGICPEICQNVFQQCKHDFFLIDSMNKMRSCKDDDIICSSLNHILDSKQGYKICNLFGIQVTKGNCWKGVPSSMTKGVSKKKINYFKKKPKSSPKSAPFILQTRYFYYIGAVLFLLLVALYKWASYKRAQFLRQIKNL